MYLDYNQKLYFAVKENKCKNLYTGEHSIIMKKSEYKMGVIMSKRRSVIELVLMLPDR